MLPKLLSSSAEPLLVAVMLPSWVTVRSPAEKTWTPWKAAPLSVAPASMSSFAVEKPNIDSAEPAVEVRLPPVM